MSDLERMTPKETLRREARARLRAMSAEAKAEASLMICRTAAGLESFQRAECVGLFAPLASEPDVRPLVEEAWARGKRVVLPLMIKHGTVPELDWHEVTSWDDVVVPGPFGLREPDPLRCARVAAAEMDCVFVPGVAFDGTGMRLGRGSGYYDSFLAKVPGTLASVGLFFAAQKVERVPSEKHDQALTCVITENGAERFSCSGGL